MKKRSILISSIVLFCSLATLTSVAPVILNAVANTFTEVAKSDFEYTDTHGYKYTVRALDVSAGPDIYPVSIAWAGDPNDTPSSLTIPGAFTGTTKEGEKNCVVYALSASSFANCDFTSVTIPESVMEIKEQSFLCCRNLTSITIPSQVNAIKTSTFSGCSNLTSVKYSDGGTGFITENTVIESIGDSAFAACTSLTSFTFPTHLTRIGRSAFQGCLTLLRAILPTEAELSVEQFAFANCPRMNIVHVPTNVVSIAPYAFADCSKLTIYTSFESETEIDAQYSTNYRKLHVATATNSAGTTADTTLIPVVPNFSNITVDDYHPDFIFSIVTGTILVEGCTSGTLETDASVLKTSSTYATIIGYAGHGEASDDFILDEYDAETGKNLDTLHIPSFLKEDPEGTSYPVYVIAKNAFSDHSEFEKIVFNDNLVKIQEEAFSRCPNIEAVEFESCTQLGEISQYVFMASANDTTKIKSLKLPASLRVLDGYAFYNLPYLENVSFRTDTDDIENRPNKLFAIGRYAFYNAGRYAANKHSCHLILPNSLSDLLTGYLHEKFGMGKAEGVIPNLNVDHVLESYAVGAYAFQKSNFIHTLEMEQCTCTTTDPNVSAQHSCNWISFGNSACRGTGMKRFISAHTLYHLHVNSFAENHNLEAAILYAEKGYDPNRTVDYHDSNIRPNNTKWTGRSNNYPIQIGFKHGIFAMCEKVVCYTNMTEADMNPRLDTQRYNWDDANTTKTGTSLKSAYVDQYYSSVYEMAAGSNSYGGGRLYVPFYYSMDLEEIKTHLDYKFGYIKTSVGGNHMIITNYTGTEKTVNFNDLVTDGIIDANYPLTEIGPYALANFTYSYNGTTYSRIINYINNLPETITKIGDGAFFTFSNANKHSNVYYGYKRITTTTASKATSSGGTSYSQYLQLPRDLQYIGDRAFMNHRFNYIKVQSPSILTHIGNGAFLVSPEIMTTVRTGVSVSVLQEMDFDTSGNSKMSYDSANGTIYYDAGGGTSYLVQANQINTSYPTTVTIKDGTTAVLARAAEGLKTDTVVLPSSLTTIYGHGFAGSTMTKVSGNLSGLKYLSDRSTVARTNWSTTEAEQFVANDYCTNITNKAKNTGDYDDPAYTIGSFRRCMFLESFDFTALTSIVGIGYESFLANLALSDMFNNADRAAGDKITYTYKKWSASTHAYSLVESRSDKILDLSNSKNLRHIGKYAFKSSPKISYLHLPCTQSSKTGESYLTLDTGIIDAITPKPVVLVGETAWQAYPQQSGKNSEKHYPAASLANSSAIYYFAESYTESPEGPSDGDVLSAAKPAAKYWAYDPDDSSKRTFVLLETRADAKDFFANH